MRYVFRIGCVALLSLAVAACGIGWKHDGGALVIPSTHSYDSSNRGAPPEAGPAGDPVATEKADPPRRISLALPDGWNWARRGDDFMATKDGVFLQNILVERIHVSQVEQSVLGAFPLAALSAKQWPLRTVDSLKARFIAGMPPADAAEVFLASRRNDPSVAGLEVREVSTQTMAGNPAFKAVFDFKLKDPGPRKAAFDLRLRDPRRMPLYRSVCYGFMRGNWVYVVGYTAALRHYFQKDLEAFESVLRSFALIEG